MDLEKTIEKVKNSCDSYIDSDLAINHINKDYFILNSPSDYVFINCGLVVPIPLLNEFDIFSVKKETVKVLQEEFEEDTSEYYTSTKKNTFLEQLIYISAVLIQRLYRLKKVIKHYIKN